MDDRPGRVAVRDPRLVDHVMGRIGLHYVDPTEAVGDCPAGLHLHLRPEVLTADGHVDFGVLGVLLDLASSMAAVGRAFVHADITVQRIAKPTGPHLIVEPSALRSGRRTAVIDVRARDSAGAWVAHSTQQTSFVRVPGLDDGDVSDEAVRARRRDFFSLFDGGCSMPVPLTELVGITEVVGRPEATVELAAINANPFGALHGGVTFALVEAAVQAAANHAGIGPVELDGAMVRYLDPGTVGPLRAVAELAPRTDGSLFALVDIVDDGQRSRLTHRAEVTVHRIAG